MHHKHFNSTKFSLTLTFLFSHIIFTKSGTRLKSTRDQATPAFKINLIKIHPVNLRTAYRSRVRVRGNSDSKNKLRMYLEILKISKIN